MSDHYAIVLKYLLVYKNKQFCKSDITMYIWNSWILWKLFEQNLYLKAIHGNWNLFKVIITNVVEKFAPSEAS